MLLKYKKYLNITLTLGLVLGIYLPLLVSPNFAYFTKLVVSSWFPESLDDYKLKFVSKSIEVQEAEAGIIKVVAPLEIVGVREVNNVIVVQSFPNSLIVSPIDCEIETKLIGDSKIVVCKKGGYTIELSGFEFLAVEPHARLCCGDPIGTLKTDLLYIKIFDGDRQVGLQELRGLL